MKVRNDEIIENVHNVALEMAERYGVKGFNMGELATKCGLAKGTLYKIIGNKEDLFLKISMEYIFAQGYKHLIDVFSDENLSYEESVEKFLEKSTDTCVGRIRVMQQQIFKEFPKIESAINDLMQQQVDVARKRFIKWQEQGVIRKDINSEIARNFVEIIHQGYVLGDKSDEIVSKEIRQIYMVFFDGLKAR